MADQRIKGQESTLFMTQNGVILAQLDSIQDAELTSKFTLLQEGYLGETTDRYDETFHGVAGNFTAHLTQASVYTVIQSIIDRARRRVPGTVFNFKTTLQFPNGQRRRIIVDNIFFSDIPNAIPKRDQYVSLKFGFGAASGRFL